jgi:hypothetical protein
MLYAAAAKSCGRRTRFVTAESSCSCRHCSRAASSGVRNFLPSVTTFPATILYMHACIDQDTSMWQFLHGCACPSQLPVTALLFQAHARAEAAAKQEKIRAEALAKQLADQSKAQQEGQAMVIEVEVGAI